MEIIGIAGGEVEFLEAGIEVHSISEVLNYERPFAESTVFSFPVSKGFSALLVIKPMNRCHINLYYSLFQKFDACSQALGADALVDLAGLV